MSVENHFVHPTTNYVEQRDLDVIGNYIKSAAHYLHRMTDQPIHLCTDFVKNAITLDEALKIKDPKVLTLTKHQPGIREKEVLTFNELLKQTTAKKQLISPSMAIYLNPETKRSILSEFIEINIKKRSTSKKEMFKYKEAGNKAMTDFKNNEQTSFKITNNSLSGAQASTGTILYNKSAHSTLTSTCRMATSYANANNEKFLFGNRHYYNAEIVKANILAISINSDLALLNKAILQYGIAIPTPEQTLECIEYSTDLYWKNSKELASIKSLVYKLTDLERAAFVYTSDLYHLAKFNDSLMRKFLGQLATKVTGVPTPEAEQYIKSLSDDTVAFVSLLCAKELNNTNLWVVLKSDNLEAINTLGATALNVINTLDEYKLFIQALLRPVVLPGSVANIRSVLRRGVVTSDTDSTIFTTQSWVEWYVGKLDFSEKGNSIFYTMTYLVTQSIIHILATVSANMGVGEKELFRLAMKNEYAFPIFSLTTMAKHYFAFMSAQEGIVFENYDTEIKGKNLKDSNIPPHLMKVFKKSLIWVMDSVIVKQEVDVEYLMRKLATIELSIIDSITKGEPTYLKSVSIKEASAYKNPESSNFLYHSLWNSVFATKYGEIGEPPYSSLKVPLSLNNPTLLKVWLDNIDDVELAQRLRDWLREKRKLTIGTICLPRAIVDNNGIPKEVIAATNVRKMVYETVAPFYLLLESLGFYIINPNLTKLISDTVKPFDDVAEAFN